MKAKDLIGKKVTRIAPCTYVHGAIDRSFMGDVLQIINADDEFISYKDISSTAFEGHTFYLSIEWCDDNWKPVDDLIVPPAEQERKNALAFLIRLKENLIKLNPFGAREKFKALDEKKSYATVVAAPKRKESVK